MVFIKVSNDYSDELQDSLNNLANAYIKKYRKDPTNRYVQNIIRKVYSDEKFFSMNFGGGYGLLTKPMAESFNNMGSLYFDIKGYSKRVAFTFGFMAAFYDNKSELTEKEIKMPFGFNHSLTSVFLGYGYDIINSKNFHLYPSVNLG